MKSELTNAAQYHNNTMHEILVFSFLQLPYPHTVPLLDFQLPDPRTVPLLDCQLPDLHTVPLLDFRYMVRCYMT